MTATRSSRPSISLADRAHESLSRMIRERELRAGDVVVEAQVAESLGISRTPLREALQRLESEGLLEKVGNRSLQVRTVGLREYLHSLRVREVLEAEAARWAAERVDPAAVVDARETTRRVAATEPYDMLAHWRADDEVHHLVIDGCGNDVMRRMLLALRVTTQLFEIDRLSDRLEPDSREHERILDALEARDGEAAHRALTEHVRSLYDFAVRVVG